MKNPSVDCNVRCPPFTKAFYSDDDNLHTCDYTEWAYTLFAVVACSVVLVPILILVCAVCKRSNRSSNASRGSNGSQYQVVSQDDIASAANFAGAIESYGTFNPGIKTPNIVDENSPLMYGASSPTSSRASVTPLLDNVSLNLRNDLASRISAPLPVSSLTNDPSVRPRMPTPSSTLNKSIDLESDVSQALVERLEDLNIQESPADNYIQPETLIDLESQLHAVRQDKSMVSDADSTLEQPPSNAGCKQEELTLSDHDSTTEQPTSDAGYIVFEPNTSDSFVNISQEPTNDLAIKQEPIYAQLEEPLTRDNNLMQHNETLTQSGVLEPPQGESTPRKNTANYDSTDDQDTLTGSYEEDDGLLRLQDSHDTEEFEDVQLLIASRIPETAATLGSPAIPYYVPLNYGKNLVDPEPNETYEHPDVLAGSPGSDSVEILPPEAESKFLDSLSTMTSSYHTAAGSIDDLSQSLSNSETLDEQTGRVEDEERRERLHSRVDFENLLMLNIQQFPVQERSGIFLLRDSVSLSDCKVLTMYAKVSTSDQEIYHFKINVMNDQRSYLVNGLRTLPNLPSLIQYLREEKDILPCVLTQEIHWDQNSSASLA